MDIQGLLIWFKENGLDLLQSIAIIAGLIYTALSFRFNSNISRLAFKQQLVLSHRELWDRYSDNKDLHRVLDNNANIVSEPPSIYEHRFVVNLIQHVSFAYTANKLKIEKLSNNSIADIKDTFTKPLVKYVWDSVKNYQDKDFTSFIEKILNDT